MNTFKIGFNKPYMTGKELSNIAEAHLKGMLAGDGMFTQKNHAWLERYTEANKALLTTSCTAALEMAALLLDLEVGDEVIMPSYTFVSTANAFVLRGAIPVFVDIRSDTLNIDETLIEPAITAKTKAIVPVHYAGVSCAMDEIMAIAERHNLVVVEDAAQGVMAAYKGKPLGAIGHLGAFSFHETKNIISGEGGALIVNRSEYAEHAEIIREKGTDRSQFFRGQVDKYTWQSSGSSFLPGEIIAAFLSAQLEEAQAITQLRLEAWQCYHHALESYEKAGLLRRPVIPTDCQHNAHMYYVLLPEVADRDAVITSLKAQSVSAVFHYVPLHSSPAGRKYGRVHGEMTQTNGLSSRILRLPLWVGITEDQQMYVVNALIAALEAN